MALPQSQCCRAINRRLRSPCDSAWLPESALAAAFEQFCSISRVSSRRNGSNVPGPLENRRRLGKRNIGELNFGHMNASPPFWEIANTVDFTQWKWTAPSTFEHRHPQREVTERGPFLASFQDWLAGPSASQSTHSQGAHPKEVWGALGPDLVAMEAVAPTSFSARTLERVDAASRQVPSEVLNVIFEDAEVLTQQCIASFQSVLSAGRFIHKGKSQTLENFCNKLALAIAQRNVSCEILCLFIERLPSEAYMWAASSGHTLSGKEISSLLIQIYTAIYEGFSVTGKVSVEHFDHHHRVYAILLDRIALLEINSLRLFQQIMASMPTEGVRRCEAEISANINTFLTALSRPLVTSQRLAGSKERANIIRQANKMAGNLKILDSDIPAHLNILNGVTKHLAGEQHATSSQHGAFDLELKRFCWLHLLARLPQLSIDYIAKACNALDTNTSTAPLTQRQICELFLAMINSRFSVRDIRALYDILNVSSGTACYASVSGKLWTTGQHRYVKVFAEFLQHLGRQQDIKHIVSGLRSHVKNQAKPLANLAIGLGHPQLALWVYIRHHQSRWKSKTFWSTAFAQEALNQLMCFKELKSEKLLDALRIHPAKRSRRRSQQPTLTTDRIQKTEKAAIAIARMRHDSERTALTRVTRCVRFLKSHDAPVPPQVLRALLHIVTRDLAAGKPGRTTRLRWYLSLLHKEAGTSKALEVGRALERWRKQLYPDKRR